VPRRRTVDSAGGSDVESATSRTVRGPGTGRKGSGAITSLPVILLGFLLGMRHATDPDHVIAVATIVTRQQSSRSAAVIGCLWGIGHTVTIMVVGGLIILFEVVIPPRIGLAMEFSVAVMLILLGITSLSGLTTRVTEALTAVTSGAGPAAGTHAHPHHHGDYVHTHPHRHEPGAHGHADAETPLSRIDHALGGLGAYQAIRPLVVGLVHGLAGSAAVALLVLAAIPNPLWAVLYLLLFGVGTMVGMMLITAVIALPFSYAAGRFAVVHRYLGLAAGLLSLGVGLVLAYQLGLADGLFAGDPLWAPR
jgi:hypothetical protein